MKNKRVLITVCMVVVAALICGWYFGIKQPADALAAAKNAYSGAVDNLKAAVGDYNGAVKAFNEKAEQINNAVAEAAAYAEEVKASGVLEGEAEDGSLVDTAKAAVEKLTASLSEPVEKLDEYVSDHMEMAESRSAEEVKQLTEVAAREAEQLAAEAKTLSDRTAGLAVPDLGALLEEAKGAVGAAAESVGLKTALNAREELSAANRQAYEAYTAVKDAWNTHAEEYNTDMRLMGEAVERARGLLDKETEDPAEKEALSALVEKAAAAVREPLELAEDMADQLQEETAPATAEAASQANTALTEGAEALQSAAAALQAKLDEATAVENDTKSLLQELTAAADAAETSALRREAQTALNAAKETYSESLKAYNDAAAAWNELAQKNNESVAQLQAALQTVESLGAAEASVQNEALLDELKAAVEEGKAALTSPLDVVTVSDDTASAMTAADAAVPEDPAEIQAQAATLTEESGSLRILAEALKDKTATTVAADYTGLIDRIRSAYSAVQADVYLAKVNGEIVTRAEVDAEYDYRYSYYTNQGYQLTEADQATLKQMALRLCVNNRLILQKAKELGEDQLTDEEMAEVQKSNEEMWAQAVANYISYATTDEHTPTEEEAYAYYAERGFTVDGTLASAIEEKVTNRQVQKIIGDASVTDLEVQEAYDAQVEADKANYGSSVYLYEMMTGYYGQTSLYRPEGYRGVTHILLQVDDGLMNTYKELVSQLEAQQAATQTDLEAAVTPEDVEAAKAAIMASVQPTVDEIMAKFNAGTPFSELVAAYGTDPGMNTEPYMSQGYAVHAESIRWDEAFKEAAMSIPEIGGVSEPALGSYGVHIVYYLQDLPTAEPLTEEVRAQIQETLLNEKQNELYESTLGLWRSEAEISYTREAADYQPAEQEENPAE